jgi:hypothetical protein
MAWHGCGTRLIMDDYEREKREFRMKEKTRRMKEEEQRI